jgi:hypothetical protein
LNNQTTDHKEIAWEYPMTRIKQHRIKRERELKIKGVQEKKQWPEHGGKTHQES